MLPSFARDSITILRPKLVEDSRKNLVADGYDSVTITHCSVQPGATAEDTAMRQTTTIRWTAYLPPAADVRSTDLVEWAGRTYQIDGEPERWQSPTGAVSHIRLLLIDWEG